MLAESCSRATGLGLLRIAPDLESAEQPAPAGGVPLRVLVLNVPT